MSHRCVSTTSLLTRSAAPRKRRTVWRALLAAFALCIVVALGPPARTQSNATPADFRIAFIGDQGNGSDAEAVLALIVSEVTDAVVHSGDFNYDDDPRDWDT